MESESYYGSFRILAKRRPHLKLLALTRPALEVIIRRLTLRGSKNIKQIVGSVVGVIADELSDRFLTHVKIRDTKGDFETLPAALVVGT